MNIDVLKLPVTYTRGWYSMTDAPSILNEFEEWWAWACAKYGVGNNPATTWELHVRWSV